MSRGMGLINQIQLGFYAFAHNTSFILPKIEKIHYSYVSLNTLKPYHLILYSGYYLTLIVRSLIIKCKLIYCWQELQDWSIFESLSNLSFRQNGPKNISGPDLESRQWLAHFGWLHQTCLIKYHQIIIGIRHLLKEWLSTYKQP